MDITYFLKLMVEKNASDLFLSTGAPVYLKVNGRLEPAGSTGLPAGVVKKIAYSLMSEGQVPIFERSLELNLALSMPGIGRFRVNVFRQRAEVAMVIRHIKATIPTIAELNMPPLLNELVMMPRGLILVVGAAGSGKSTTLASMIDYRNSGSFGHILTIEDPIEYLHTHRKSVVNQREIGVDTLNYANGLKSALREAPDVILIGEILDTGTMQAAISYAETGQLCLATLHSSNADQTLGRILNFFPEGAHDQVLMDLSLNLKAIASQRLVTTKSGQRKPATEILINTPRIADMVRKGEINGLKQAMEKSLDAGMHTFDQSLYKLHHNREITLDEALRNADSREGLALRIRLSDGGEGDLAGTSDDA